MSFVTLITSGQDRLKEFVRTLANGAESMDTVVIHRSIYI